MIYGKRYYEVPADADDYRSYPQVHVTVTGTTTSIKQGNELLQLSWGQIGGLIEALAKGIVELETDPFNVKRNGEPIVNPGNCVLADDCGNLALLHAYERVLGASNKPA